MNAFDDQSAVDAAFADLDELLATRAPAPVDCRACRNCGSSDFQRAQNDGHIHSYYDVCLQCGAIAESSFGVGDAHYYPPRRISSNYKRIHHWHERVSQLFLCESAIPDAQFLQIAERLLDGTHPVINKDVIRGVLRSLSMQLYIEKWLQIIQRLTGIEPPKPGGQLLTSLDACFTELQQPFAACKASGRKNFLNYNYTFCRLFQKLGCAQFCMFFPLIKSRQKLRALDAMWGEMVSTIGWEVKPLSPVAPFCVRLRQPELLLQAIRQQCAAQAPVETRTVPWKTEFRKSDQFLLRELDRQMSKRKRPRGQPVPELQMLGSSVKRPRSSKVRGPQLLRR